MKITKSYLKQIIKEEMQKLAESEEKQYSHAQVLKYLKDNYDSTTVSNFTDNKNITSQDNFLLKVGDERRLFVLRLPERKPILTVDSKFRKNTQ